MTEFKLNWSEESIGEYVDVTLKGKGRLQALPAILFAICVVLMVAAGIVLYFITTNITCLLLSACGVIFGVGVIILLKSLKKSLTKKVTEAYKDQTDLIAAISEKDIIFIRNGLPCGVTSWDKVADIGFGKTAFFLTTHDNVLIILEKNAVVSGVISEAEEVLKLKAEAIRK